MCVRVGAFTFRRLFLGFFGSPETQRFARRTRPVRADELHMHDIVRLRLQIPQCTAPRGSVHFLYEAKHVHILFLSGAKCERQQKQQKNSQRLKGILTKHVVLIKVSETHIMEFMFLVYRQHIDQIILERELLFQLPF